MPAIPITLQPGINTQETPALNAAGYSESSSIRFFQGLAQKTGGFTKFCQVTQSPATIDLGRSIIAMRAWAALSGILNLAVAGENLISLFQANTVYDITPQTRKSLIPIAASTNLGNDIVRITDNIDAAPQFGDWVRLRAPISVAGIILDGPYFTSPVSGQPNTFLIFAALAANATLVNAGVARRFTTTASSSVVQVYFPDHGLSTGTLTRVTDPQPVGGLTLEGNYLVTVVDQDNYEITDDEIATSSQTIDENGGNMALTFYTPRSMPAQNTLEVDSIALDTWGEFLMAIPRGGPVYVWKPGDRPSPMTNTTTAPQANTFGFVSTQQQILVVCGSVNDATSLFDPLLVRWSDAGDYTDFTPSVTNQAGSFRLQLGSACIAGISIGGRCLIWTDLGLYAMQYEGLPLVWGFQPLGTNCGLIGPQAMGVLGDENSAVWMSHNQFFVSAGGGTPQVIPCPIWDRVFKNLSKTSGKYTACITNSYFNEVTWYVPQSDDTIVAARLQVDTGNWDYTSMAIDDPRARSAGIDQNVFGAPMGGAADGIVYQEETGRNADTAVLPARLLTGIAMLSDSDEFVALKSLQPDVKFTESGPPRETPDALFAPPATDNRGTLEMTVYVYRNPQEAPRMKGPYRINARTRSVPCKTRGRGIQFEFASSDLDSFWRLGRISYIGAPDGKGG